MTDGTGSTSYSYHPVNGSTFGAGNLHTIDGQQITQTTHNNRNQIVSETAGGWMRVRGTTNEPATVCVKSNANAFTPATLQGGNQFSGWVTVVPGANSVTIEAKDRSPNANTKINSYTINVTGSSRTPTYDLNGNTTSNGTGQTYQWDAEDRLIKIIYADNSSTEFTYDGLSRRVRITEKSPSNAIVTDKRYLWAGGNQPAEERNGSGLIVLKQYHPQGEFIPAATAPLNKLFYTKDHLGSVRELVDGNGALQTRYDYDMWGKRVKLSGTLDTDVGYTGHHHHAKSGLVLTWYRAYDAEAGRWLSADPIGEAGGVNLYGYLGGDPVNWIDPLGLEKGSKKVCFSLDFDKHGAPHVDAYQNGKNIGRFRFDGSGVKFMGETPKLSGKNLKAFNKFLKGAGLLGVAAMSVENAKAFQSYARDFVENGDPQDLAMAEIMVADLSSIAVAPMADALREAREREVQKNQKDCE